MIMSFFILLATLFYTPADAAKPPAPPVLPADKLPIVFHPRYDISFFGIERLHPFDSKKYGKVYALLQQNLHLIPSQFYTPRIVADTDLRLVHTDTYLESLNSSTVLSQITEIPLLAYLPNRLLRWKLLTPMKYATGGTILGAQLALKHGSSINLGGGYHHAAADEGGGFCVYADIPIAIHFLWQKHPTLKVLIIDLDAHQGNGHENVFLHDSRLNKQIFIFDIYNEDIYPNDINAKKAIRFHYPVKSYITDADYLPLLRNNLAQALQVLIKEGHRPDLIIYNAGTDIFEKDPLGNMRITEKGIIERDQIVFEEANRYNIPLEMVLSGGYTRDSARIISNSIKNLMDKKLLTNFLTPKK